MFVPGHYREPSGSWMVDLIRRNPLALLVSNGAAGDAPFATHLPVIPEPGTPDWAPDMSGAVLFGHMNRANPHWTALADGNPILLTFTGPHGYVSPTVYGISPAAPTWNFTAVHVYGVVHKIAGTEQTLEVVQDTVRAFEAEFGAGWDMAESVDYFRQIVPGVGAFRVEVTRADGMFKLSQEQKPGIRERVRASFAQRETVLHRETARLMGLLPEPSAD